MFKTFKNSYLVTISTTLNFIIFYLKRVPLIKKLIPQSLYKETSIKVVLGVIVEIFKSLFAFVRKFTYVLIMCFMATFFLQDFLPNSKELEFIKDLFIVIKSPDFLKVSFYIFFILTFICGSILKSNIFERDTTIFTMIRLMRVNPRDYYLSSIIYKLITDFIWFIPTLIILFKFSLGESIIILLQLVLFRVIGECVNLILYEKFNFVILNNIYTYLTLSILGLILAYLPPYLGYIADFGSILFNPLFIITTLILGTITLIYIFTYKNFVPLSRVIVGVQSMVDINNLETTFTFGEVMLDEKNLKNTDVSKDMFSTKKGFDYLNSLFFSRHKTLIYKLLKIRIAGITLAFLATILVMFIYPNFKDKIFNFILGSAAIVVFIMYLISFAETICKSFFFNCDISLLRYPFFKEKKAILSNFTTRLKVIVLLNLIPAVALVIELILLFIIGNRSEDIMKAIPIFITVLSLACFFSVHHLFLYYVTQPYTSSLKVKSPAFKVANTLVYIFSYICLQIDNASYYFSIGIIIATLVYIIIALAITYKVAPKTFKLR